MTPNTTFAIVGAGLAGAKAAETLREEGFDGRLVLLGAEAERPTSARRCPRTTCAASPSATARTSTTAGFYAEHDIELRVDETVVDLDAGRRELALKSGERLGYDRLLLTTGSEPRRLSIPGSELDGVHYLRTLADSDALRARLDAGGRLVVIGAGWIGAEVAASARQRGVDVTIIAPHSVPFERVLGPEVGAIYRDIHHDHGVEMLLGAAVESFEGDARVERVRTQDGPNVACDARRRRNRCHSRAGARRRGGACGRQRHPRRRAPGDERPGDLRRGRRRQPPPSRRSAGCASSTGTTRCTRARRRRAACSAPTTPTRARRTSSPTSTTSVWSTPGYAPTWDRVVFRGDPATREFIAFWLADGRVVAGMNVNVWDVAEPIQALISGRP